MGAVQCCCTEDRGKSRFKDLQPFPIEGCNAFQRFERSFPFSRMYIDSYEKLVREAAEKV